MKRVLSVMLAVIATAIGFASSRVTGSQGGEAAHEDCRVATMLSRFARIYGTFEQREIDEKRESVCKAPMTGRSIAWQNKETMKTVGGTWSYPNGNTARTQGRNWTYPNNEDAKRDAGTWSYPDGNTARSSGGNWTRPDRKAAKLAELRSWACKRVAPADCTRLSAEFRNGESDEEVIAMLELAWMAR